MDLPDARVSGDRDAARPSAIAEVDAAQHLDVRVARREALAEAADFDERLLRNPVCNGRAAGRRYSYRRASTGSRLARPGGWAAGSRPTTSTMAIKRHQPRRSGTASSLGRQGRELVDAGGQRIDSGDGFSTCALDPADAAP